jgi:hypothetical protein
MLKILGEIAAKPAASPIFFNASLRFIYLSIKRSFLSF